MTAGDGTAVVAFLRGRDVACPSCGYNLRDQRGALCPECGLELDAGRLRAWARRTTREIRVVLWALAIAMPATLGVLAVFLPSVLIGGAFAFVSLAVVVLLLAELGLAVTLCVRPMWYARRDAATRGLMQIVAWVWLGLAGLVVVGGPIAWVVVVLLSVAGAF